MNNFSRLLLLAMVPLLGNPLLQAGDKIVVHEWGTFTCLQDEAGQAIKGINTDDEPVPPFVHDHGGVQVAPQYSREQENFGLPPYRSYVSKGWIPGDPEVTMRLETPVIYFYPPKGGAAAALPTIHVRVDFHGGILSQYYPYARLSGVPESLPGAARKKHLLEHMNSTLLWKDVRIGFPEKPVPSTDKVWTTPREVGAEMLAVGLPTFSTVDGKTIEGESKGWEAERFLFYRGVGHLDSPVRLQDGDGRLGVWPQTRSWVAPYAHAWLVEIYADGSCAFRDVPPPNISGTELRPTPWALCSGKFEPEAFSSAQLTQLKASMQAALVQEGLYPDEASAMLRTWELSYFKSPGLRFFYTVPRSWTDKVLPLKITGAPTEVTRVMIGRVELISDPQRAALARLAAGPCPDLAAVKEAARKALDGGQLTDAQKDTFYRGEKPLAGLGITIPPLVADYLSLGRFRDALILHEQEKHPTPALAKFIQDNSLAPPEGT